MIVDSSIFFTKQYLSTLFNKIPLNENGIVTYGQLLDFIQEENDLLFPERIRNILKEVADSKSEDEILKKDFIEFVMNEKYSNKFEKYLNIYMSYILPPPPPPFIDKFYKSYGEEELESYDESKSNIEFSLNRMTTFRSPIIRVYNQMAKISLEDITETPERIYHFWPLPLAMILISLSEIVLYIIDTAHSRDWNGVISKQLIYNPSRRIEMWRYLTYMFVHSGTWHLSMNILFQLTLGIPLELHYSWYPIIFIYCSGVISGALGSSITHSFAWLTGASGGVYALLMAHIVSIIMSWKRMNHRKIVLIFLLAFILVDILRVIIEYSTGNLNRSISYSSHFFGGLSGILLGTIVFKQFSHKYKRKPLILIFVIIFIILFSSAVLINIFSTNKFPK